MYELTVQVIDPSLELLHNDTDPEGGAPRPVSFTQPAHGTLMRTARGTLSYAPDADFNGVDTFVYTVADAGGDVASARAVLDVEAVNDAPILTPGQSGRPLPGPGVINAALVEGGTIRTEENSGGGRQVEALDPDTGDELVFEFLPGDNTAVPDGVASLTDGRLMVTGLPPRSYELDVRVEDAQDLVSIGRVIVNVTRLDDGEPELDAAIGELPVLSLPDRPGGPTGFAGKPMPAVATDPDDEEKEEALRSMIWLVEGSMPDHSPVGPGHRTDMGVRLPAIPPGIVVATPFIEVDSTPGPQASLQNAGLSPLSPLSIEQFDRPMERIRSAAEALGEQEESERQCVTLVVAVGGVVFSIGFAAWLLSSRLLMAAALSTLSLWRPLDPIPVLLGGGVPGTGNGKGNGKGSGNGEADSDDEDEVNTGEAATRKAS